MQIEMVYERQKVTIIGCVFGGDIKVYVNGLKREDVTVSMVSWDYEYLCYSKPSLPSWSSYLLDGPESIEITVEMDGESILIGKDGEFFFGDQTAVARDSSHSNVPCTIDWGYDACPLVCLAAEITPMSAERKQQLVSIALDMFGCVDELTTLQCYEVLDEESRQIKERRDKNEKEKHTRAQEGEKQGGGAPC